MKTIAMKLIPVVALSAIVLVVARFDPSGRIINLPGLAVAVIGTLVATCLGQSFEEVFALLKQLPQKLLPVAVEIEEDVALFIKMADIFRQGNVRQAEFMVRRIESDYLRSGSLLVLDRAPYADVARVMQWKLGAQRERDRAEIQIFRTMMTFAPAFGMLGTLFGLITMLYGLDVGNLSQLGEAMGFAMLTTVYGLIIANVVCRPIVTRLEARSRERLAWLHVQIEAVLMLHEKSHSQIILDYFDAFSGRQELRAAQRSFEYSELKSAA